MSSNSNSYVILGVRLDFEKYGSDTFFEKYSEYDDNSFKGIEHHNGLAMLFDGMNGNYIIIGEIKEKTEQHQGFSDIVIADRWESEKPHIKALIQQYFTEIEPPDLFIASYVLTHYS